MSQEFEEDLEFEDAAPDLKPREEFFCHRYIVNMGNATQAAIDAGYSEKTARQAGSRLLTNVDIQKRIQRLRNEYSRALAKKTEIDIEYIEQGLADVVEKCLQRKPIKPDTKDFGKFKEATLFDDLDVPDVYAPFNPAGAARALELLGKQRGMFTDNINLKTDNDIAAAIIEGRKRSARMKDGWGDEDDDTQP